MNDKFGVPMAVTNCEIRENGEIKNSASDDDCGVGDSLKVSLRSNDDLESRKSVPDSKSDLELVSGMSCDYPVLKGSASVSNLEDLPANMLSKQVDPCDPDSKASNSLVEDSTDTSLENEVEDDFKLTLSPEASVGGILSQQKEEDSTVQATEPLSSRNIVEDMEVDKHEEESKLSEETEDPNLGNKSPDIGRLNDVNLGSDINDCAIGEGVAGGDSEMSVDEGCASDACVGNTSNNESGSDMPSSLKEGAHPLKGTSETSEETQESSTSATASGECGDAALNSNIEDCPQSSISSLTQDEIEHTALGANTEGCQMASTSCAAQEEVEEGSKQNFKTKGCSEILNNFSCSEEKSTNLERVAEPVLDKVKNNGEHFLDVKNNVGCALDDIEKNVGSVVDELEINAEPVVDENDTESVVGKLENNAKPVLDERNPEPIADDLESNAEHVVDDLESNSEPLCEDDLKKNAEPVLDNLDSNSEPVSDDLKKNAEPGLDNLDSNSAPVSDDLKKSAEPGLDNLDSNSAPVSDDLKKNAEPGLDNLDSNSAPVSDDLKKNAEPVLDNLDSSAEPVSDDLKKNAEPVLDNLDSNAEPVSDDLKKNAEPVLDNLDSNAEPVSDDLKKNAEPVLDTLDSNAESVLDGLDSPATVVDGQGENSFRESSSGKESVNDVVRKLEKTSDVQVKPDKHRSEIRSENVSGENSRTVEMVTEKLVLQSDNVSESNVDSIASPFTKTKDCSNDDEITSFVDESNDEGTASPSSKINDDSCQEGITLPTNSSNDDGETTSPTSKTSDGNIDKSEEDKEDALLVSPNRTTSVSDETRDSALSMEVEDEDLLKSPVREKEDDQIVDMEEEAALLSSPDRKAAQNKLLEEGTEGVEDDALLNSPGPKLNNDDETDIEMKEDDLLKSPEVKTIVGNANVNDLQEKLEDGLNSPKLGIALPETEDVVAPEEIAKSDLEEDVPVKLKDEGAETHSPACQVTEPLKAEASNKSDPSLNSDTPAEEVESMEAVEFMEVDDGPMPAKGEGEDSKEEKPELKLELNGTSDCSDHSDIKSTNLSHSSRKDDEGSSSMTLSRKRAHSPVTDSKESDEKSKFARTVNGFSEDSPSEEALPEEKDDVSSAKKKYEVSSDSDTVSDETASKISTPNSEDSEVKKDTPEVRSECKKDVKRKSQSEASQLDPVDLSYLRKLNKGRVEKLSRNDLEELLVQKLCEAITERSEVGDMRLRCQALERGQEKWKEKYNQLQKQVRELNIVIRKFLSEQASATKEKGTPSPPVRITRSVGLQVALPGSSQRTLAGMRMRAQREAAAAAASSAVSAVVASAVTSSGSSNPNKSAITNSPNASTAQNPGPIRTATVTQTPTRRHQETPTKITSPTIQQLPQRQVNSSVSSNNTASNVNVTPPRVSAVPQPCLTLSRPVMSPQVQSQIQTTQLGGNVRARPNTTVAMRSHTQTHIVHQVQQRQQPLQATQHTSVSQVVMSSTSTPQIGRLQVVLAPQQQQQLLQQQQLVLRQPQPASKDVEIIDLDKDDRSRQPTRSTVQQIQQVTTSPSFSPNGNMTVRLVSNQQSGVPLTSQSHMTLLVPATAQQQKMIITSTPSTVQLNSNQGKSRPNSGVVLKGVVQAMQAQGSTVRQQGVVQQGTIIPSRGLTIVQQPQQAQQQMPQLQQLRPLRQMGHPAPLPAAPSVQPDNPAWKMPPPKPSLKIQHTDNGIVLSWNMNLYSSHEDIDTYQLYAYQEGNSPPSSSLWKKVGDVKALPLPMACTLTQFAEGHRYHFAVRAVDIRARIGPFSAPGNIRLEQKNQ